jgi:PadR family transcriptional regulator AphA
MTPKRTTAEDAALEPLPPGMASEHALLGLLALDERGAGHGYDLARQFEPGAPLGNVIRIEPGMVYHHIKKLERLGWVTVETDAPVKPARKLVALTGKGQAELGRWLAEPVAHTREIRLEFLVKLYFALLLDPGLAVRLITEQKERCARLIELISERLAVHVGDDDASLLERRFGDLVLDMRLAQTRTALAWLDRVEEEAKAASSRSDGLLGPS